MSNLTSHPPDPEFLSSLQFTPMLPSEEAFLFKSWLKGYRTAERVVDMRNDAYFAYQHRQIEKILDGGAQVLMARGLTDPDFLCGFLVSDVMDDFYIVHWCFTKQSYRGLGVLKSLITHDIAQRGIDVQPGKAVYSHQRHPFSDIFDRLNFRYVHF